MLDNIFKTKKKRKGGGDFLYQHFLFGETTLLLYRSHLNHLGCIIYVKYVKNAFMIAIINQKIKKMKKVGS
jgi:hypothetical protein